MKLTPLDIQHKEFRRAIRGYNEEEVDSFLDEVVKEFERLFNENIELKEKYEKANEKLKQYEGLEQTLQKTLLTAQQAADEIQNNAKKEAELIIKDAEVKAKELVQQVASNKHTLEKEALALKEAERNFIDKFQELLNTFKETLDKIKSGEKPSDVFKAIKLPSIEQVKERAENQAPVAEASQETQPLKTEVNLEETQAMSVSELGWQPQSEAPEQTVTAKPEEKAKKDSSPSESVNEEQAIKITLGTPGSQSTSQEEEEKLSESTPPKKPKAVEIAEKMSSFFDDDLGMEENEATSQTKKSSETDIQEIS